MSNLEWKLKFMPEALDDLDELNPSVKNQILKGIRKVLQNPESRAVGGYGEPLGNKRGINLTGLYKIKFRGLGQRVVYAIERHENAMTIIIISAREDFKVYDDAEKRRKKHDL